MQTSILSNWLYSFSKDSKKFENQLNAVYRKSTGSYYTSIVLAKDMVDDLLLKTEVNHLENKRFLEPCVGSGVFVFAYLSALLEKGFSINQMQKVISNLYCSDVNLGALKFFETKLSDYCNKILGVNLDEDYFTEHLSTGLLYDLTQKDINYIDIFHTFPKIKEKFDIVITNPPYKNLKAESNKYKNEKQLKDDKNTYSFITKDAKKHFKYSLSGTQNLYKLFVEDIIATYTNENALISLLIPNTLLSDKSCQSLRDYILQNHKIHIVKQIPENNPYVDAKQSLCTMLIQKGERTQHFDLVKNIFEKNQEKVPVDANSLSLYTSNRNISAITGDDYDLLRQLKKYPSIKDLNFIHNMRGELDLSLNKEYISNQKTDFKLLRGRNIGYYSLKETNLSDYIAPAFYAKTQKSAFISKPRLACQQISNMNKKRRIVFAYVSENYILGNSCNFISVTENNVGIDLYNLLGILNSSLINWFFKLTSSNNHVSNHEINNFPIPINSKKLNEISRLIKEYFITKNEDILAIVDKLVYEAYNLKKQEKEDKTQELSSICAAFFNDIKQIIPNINQSQTKALLEKSLTVDSLITSCSLQLDSNNYDVLKLIVEKYHKLNNGNILNHSTFKLSDLDLEMVKSVPQGGNWQNIPNNIVEKSKRLQKIQKTGGRTTLYGRLDYNKPSYTITTYFSRPGNGTYIHPKFNRVLSVREAARFQSFDDCYFFIGNKTDLLNQVGNAVPPILAYEIAKSILKHIKCKTSIDLFCGAGGLTVGFKKAGIKSILGTDFDKKACLTFKVNNPEIPVLCGDITNPEIKKQIVKTGKDCRVDIICGGPPCQGFSLAGKRFIEDPRNQLFKHFIDVVAAVRPKIVLFENVEGLLTFQKGQVYQEILSLFSQIGYKIEGRLLKAVEYGVPQKRKRVIIIAIRNDLGITPSAIFPEKTTEDIEKQVVVKDVIKDLEDISCSENALYKDTSIPLSAYTKLMRSFTYKEEKKEIKGTQLRLF